MWVTATPSMGKTQLSGREPSRRDINFSSGKLSLYDKWIKQAFPISLRCVVRRYEALKSQGSPRTEPVKTQTSVLSVNYDPARTYS